MATRSEEVGLIGERWVASLYPGAVVMADMGKPFHHFDISLVCQVKTYEGPVLYGKTGELRHGLEHEYFDQLLLIVDGGNVSCPRTRKRSGERHYSPCLWLVPPCAERIKAESTSAPSPWFVRVKDCVRVMDLPGWLVAECWGGAA